MKNAYIERLVTQAELNASRGCTKAMSTLHLLDLKRAGHSPTKTELHVPEGHSPARLDTPHTYTSASVAGWMVA